MDILKVPSVCFQSSPEDNLIKEGDKVVLKRDKYFKFVTVVQNKLELCEKAKFRLDGAIGKPYGSIFLIRNDELEHITDRRQYENFESTFVNDSEGDVSTKDNRNLLANSNNQILKPDDINQFRAEGKTGAEIVVQLVENSASFSEKTAFSREKYIKKKKKKHIDVVNILRPTTRVLCELYAARGIQKIIGLRIDTVSFILSHANVHSGANVLLHETCAGLLMGSVLERQGGSGNVLNFYHGTAPHRPEMHGTLVPIALHRIFDIPLQEATALRITCNYARHASSQPTNRHRGSITTLQPPAKQARVLEEDDQETREESTSSPKPDTTAGDQKPQLKRSLSFDELEKRRMEKKTRLDVARTILFSETWHSLIMASKFHPTVPFLTLLHFLSPGSPFVVYCQRMQPLAELFELLKRRGDVLMLELSEGWLRSYQVLPDRTHPEMTTTGGGGGYLLTGYNGCSEHGKTRPPEKDYEDGLISM